MMTCRNVQHLFQQFIDGDLSASMTAEVHAHLLQCPACQRDVEVARASTEVISRDQSEPALKPGFASQVVAAMMEQQPRFKQVDERAERRFRWRKYAMVGGLPAAAAAMFLFSVLWPTPPAEQPDKMVLGVSVGDATGVSQVMSPTVEAVSDARDAARSLNQVLRISAGQAGAGVRRGLERLEKAADGPADPSFMEIFLQPFDTMLTAPPSNTTDSASDIIRF
ncbi:MAG: hypothetical protein DCC65_08475 [Planctomycetota bacterium]|nr:MAG: hypothetical protein DCC65_08475 [Planctomycetota bacterium]